MRRKNPAPHLAGRFAAKEAGMKAIGTGHAFGVLWRDLEVIRHGGPPQLQFHNAAAGHFARVGASRALLTITHTNSLALAHVILVGEARRPRPRATSVNASRAAPTGLEGQPRPPDTHLFRPLRLT